MPSVVPARLLDGSPLRPTIYGNRPNRGSCIIIISFYTVCPAKITYPTQLFGRIDLQPKSTEA